MSGRVPQKRGASCSDDGDDSPPRAKRTAGMLSTKRTSTITKAAVVSFFTRTSEKAGKVLAADRSTAWRTVESSLIVGEYMGAAEADGRTAGRPGSTTTTTTTGMVQPKARIAAFDFDSTLISTASKARFAKGASDWSWWHASVPARLKQLHADGYLLVIMSNQNGISLRPSAAKNTAPKMLKTDRFTEFKQKASAVFTALDLPITIYAATEKDWFRKPATGMWKEFIAKLQLCPDQIDLDQSIFVGDAAGRVAGTYNGRPTKADFSCSDRNFASNLGIPFTTPEQYFLGEPARPHHVPFEPSIYSIPAGQHDLALPASPSASAPHRPVFAPSSSQELVVLVGFPGAGKSTFFARHLAPHGYVRINQDRLGSRDRCIKAASDALAAGQSVAIDNTNPDRPVRQIWLNLARKHGNLPARCIYLTAARELARHNDVVRGVAGATPAYRTLNPDSREILPPLAFNSFAARFQLPDTAEGFTHVIHVDFVFSGSDEEKSIWSRYWF